MDLELLKSRFILDKFWNKFNKLKPNNNGCVEWTYNLDGDGYGAFCFRLGGRKGKYYKYLSHRVIFFLSHGIINDNILHKCNNRSCVNIDHLYDGTTKENMYDRAIAETHRATKLSLKDVGILRDMYNSGHYTQRQLGKIFEIAPSAVHYNLHKRVGIL